MGVLGICEGSTIQGPACFSLLDARFISHTNYILETLCYFFILSIYIDIYIYIQHFEHTNSLEAKIRDMCKEWPVITYMFLTVIIEIEKPHNG